MGTGGSIWYTSGQQSEEGVDQKKTLCTKNAPVEDEGWLDVNLEMKQGMKGASDHRQSEQAGRAFPNALTNKNSQGTHGWIQLPFLWKTK